MGSDTGAERTDTAGSIDQRAGELAAQIQQWSAASNRLFALGMADEEAYIDAVRLVGIALTHLRAQASSVDGLLAAGPDVLALLEAEVRANPPGTPIDLRALLDAARGVRYGEITSLTGQGPVISHN
jgi:hypothetical protein